jgi:hypothetical protein
MDHPHRLAAGCALGVAVIGLVTGAAVYATPSTSLVG